MRTKKTYKYVIGIRLTDGFEKLIGALNIDVVMNLVVGWVIHDKEIESWTVMEFADAKKAGLTGFVHEICLGPAKRKKCKKKKK